MIKSNQDNKDSKKGIWESLGHKGQLSLRGLIVGLLVSGFLFSTCFVRRNETFLDNSKRNVATILQTAVSTMMDNNAPRSEIEQYLEDITKQYSDIFSVRIFQNQEQIMSAGSEGELFARVKSFVKEASRIHERNNILPFELYRTSGPDSGCIIPLTFSIPGEIESRDFETKVQAPLSSAKQMMVNEYYSERDGNYVLSVPNNAKNRRDIYSLLQQSKMKIDYKYVTASVIYSPLNSMTILLPFVITAVLILVIAAAVWLFLLHNRGTEAVSGLLRYVVAGAVLLMFLAAFIMVQADKNYYVDRDNSLATKSTKMLLDKGYVSGKASIAGFLEQIPSAIAQKEKRIQSMVEQIPEYRKAMEEQKKQAAETRQTQLNNAETTFEQEMERLEKRREELEAMEESETKKQQLRALEQQMESARQTLSMQRQSFNSQYEKAIEDAENAFASQLDSIETLRKEPVEPKKSVRSQLKPLLSGFNRKYNNDERLRFQVTFNDAPGWYTGSHENMSGVQGRLSFIFLFLMGLIAVQFAFGAYTIMVNGLEGIKTFFSYFFIEIFVLLCMLPVLWIITASFFSETDVKSLVSIVSEGDIYTKNYFTLENYDKNLGGLISGEDSDGMFLVYFKNSLIVSGITAVLCGFLGVISGYAFSRFHFPGRQKQLMWILISQLFPMAMMIVPLYIVSQIMGINKGLTIIVIAYTATSLPFAIWMMKGYFDTIPADLEEAAAIDGASTVGRLIHVLLPLARPAIATTIFYSFITAWNEFVIASFFLNQAKIRTLPVALYAMLDSFNPQYALFSAAGVLASLPVVLIFLYLQKHLVSGLTAGGVKG